MSILAYFKNVSHSYGKQIIIDQVSFDLKSGEITTLIGPNGAGKTTIAKLLLSINSPIGGDIKVFAKKVSYAPQQLELNPNLPITTNDLLRYLAPEYRNSKFFDDVADFINFKNLASYPVEKLSGGQRQRILLGAAILQNPELMVLDEPTQGLDVNSQDAFYYLIEKVRTVLGTTIFIISHDLFTVMKNADQVLCLNKHICCQGRPTHTVVKGSDAVGFYTHHHDHAHN
jgi:zinc transport system ATP-binding protein